MRLRAWRVALGLCLWLAVLSVESSLVTSSTTDVKELGEASLGKQPGSEEVLDVQPLEHATGGGNGAKWRIRAGSKTAGRHGDGSPGVLPLNDDVLLQEDFNADDFAAAVPRLDASLAKSNEAAKLANSAADALKKAEAASAVAESITEAALVAQAESDHNTWESSRKHEKATIVVAAKAMKAAAAAKDHANDLVAKAALLEHKAEQEAAKASTAKHAFKIATQKASES